MEGSGSGTLYSDSHKRDNRDMSTCRVKLTDCAKSNFGVREKFLWKSVFDVEHDLEV